jgi:hypothetical protein
MQWWRGRETRQRNVLATHLGARTLPRAAAVNYSTVDPMNP